MTRTTLFMSDAMQAVRLPKDLAFPASVRDVVVFKDGNRRIIVPSEGSWDDFFDAPGIDLPDRMQPGMQERNGL